jgi:hypothetical protein
MGFSPGEAARRKVDDALRCMADDLKAGRGDGFTAYLGAMSRFPHHSWDNVLLISVHRPTASRMAGHHGWHDLGRAVRAGEKGILLFAAPDRDLFRRTGARMTYVFDVSQTEGRPLSEPESVHRPQARERLEAILAQRELRDRSVAEGVAYVAGRVLDVESGTEHTASMAPHAADVAAFAQRLATVQETAEQILEELLAGERSAAIGGPGPALPRLDGRNFEQLHLRYRERLVIHSAAPGSVVLKNSAVHGIDSIVSAMCP